MNYKFIFARYNENIDWIYKYPFIANNAIIYNKGKNLAKNDSFLTEILSLSNTPDYGRESDTYLSHIIKNYDNLDDYIFFSQADPFDHSPEFVDIVKYIIDNNIYKTYQPLSSGWKVSQRVPPIENLLYDTGENISKYRLYMEIIDDQLQTIGYVDNGIQHILKDFTNFYNIHNKSRLMFLYEKLNLTTKPYAGFLKFNYGGLFGVSKDALLNNNKNFYTTVRSFAHEHYTCGFMIERLWYTFFLNNI